MGTMGTMKMNTMGVWVFLGIHRGHLIVPIVSFVSFVLNP
jgi:hypothetical protein